MTRYLHAAKEFGRYLQPGDISVPRVRALDIVVARDHQLAIRPHLADCTTEHCDTMLEVHCSCGWMQGCRTITQAERLELGHLADPSQAPVKAGSP